MVDFEESWVLLLYARRVRCALLEGCVLLTAKSTRRETARVRARETERDRERQREKERDRERQREKEAKGGSLSPEAPSGLHPMESNDGGPNQPMTIGVWYTFVIPETLPR